MEVMAGPFSFACDDGCFAERVSCCLLRVSMFKGGLG